MAVGVHALAINLTHKVPLENTKALYFGEVVEAGAEYSTGGYTMENASTVRYELPAVFSWIEIAANAVQLEGLPKSGKVKAYWTKSEHVKNDEVSANTDLHTSIAGAAVFIVGAN
jgi:hypothetical protein